MKCLYPPRLNSDPGRGTKMSSSPQVHTNPRKVAHKSSFYKRLTINLEASGLGGGAAVGETCDQQGPGRGQGGELSAVSCWPLSCPPVDRECLGPNQTLGRILGCLSRDRSSLESAPSSTPSGCLCPTQGGHSRPGVLDEAVPVGRPSTGPCGTLLPLSPHEVPVHFRSCQVSVFSFWGRGAPGRPQPGSRPRTAAHSRARPTVGLQHTDDRSPTFQPASCTTPRGPALVRVLGLGLLGPSRPLQPSAPELQLPLGAHSKSHTNLHPNPSPARWRQKPRIRPRPALLTESGQHWAEKCGLTGQTGKPRPERTWPGDRPRGGAQRFPSPRAARCALPPPAPRPRSAHVWGREEELWTLPGNPSLWAGTPWTGRTGHPHQEIGEAEWCGLKQSEGLPGRGGLRWAGRGC
ncbi:keratinocyte proline-rich protein-like [Delphinapterus leucas]|uniref:Keratinocyte proline-rich protein-like n=1 Tax=Delphinapterus leucas TaxID=9749 RepID=A0A2Y9NJL4_DELLE|nr:keratinocyte proline-rich protein-like [Delphinapterus leucas]